MSYYIEFKTKHLKLRRNIPEDLIKFLDSMVNDKSHDPWKAGGYDDHELFKQERWVNLFRASPFYEFHENYQPPIFVNIQGYWRLFIWTEINHGFDEIQLFAKWIKPFLVSHKPKDYIGWFRGEAGPTVNLYAEL